MSDTNNSVRFDFNIENAIKDYLEISYTSGYSIFTGFCFNDVLPDNCIIINVEESVKQSFLGNWRCKVFVNILTKLDEENFLTQVEAIRALIFQADLVSSLNTISQTKEYKLLISTLDNIKFKNSYSDNAKISTIELDFIVSNV